MNNFCFYALAFSSFFVLSMPTDVQAISICEKKAHELKKIQPDELRLAKQVSESSTKEAKLKSDALTIYYKIDSLKKAKAPLSEIAKAKQDYDVATKAWLAQKAITAELSRDKGKVSIAIKNLQKYITEKCSE